MNQDGTYLRLFAAPETAAESFSADRNGRSGLTSLCDAFSQATGWSLRLSADPPEAIDSVARDPDLQWSAPVDPGDGTALGHLRMGPAAGETQCDQSAAVRLAKMIGEQSNELGKCRHALRDRDAEFADNVTSPIRRENSRRFTQRLELILQNGGEALNCDAAAVYILDEETTQLKLRASWGLPVIRLAEDPRQLEGATADLEALIGHAVVLEDDKLFEFWRVPEPDYAAAVCVPIASAATILGTFWLFSSAPRDFSERDQNLIEIIGGRFAAELERDALLAEMRR